MLRFFLKRFYNRNSEDKDEDDEEEEDKKESKSPSSSSSHRTRKLGGNLQHELESVQPDDEEMRVVAEKKYSDPESNPRPLLQQSLDNNRRMRVSKGEKKIFSLLRL